MTQGSTSLATRAAAMVAGAQNGCASSPTMKALSEPWIGPTAPGIGGCDHTRCTRPSKGSGLIQRKRPSTHGIFVRPTRRAFGWPWTGGTPQPVGLVARDHLMAVYSAVKRATKGLQRETVAMAVANVGEGHAQRDAAGKRGTASGLLVEAGIHPWV